MVHTVPVDGAMGTTLQARGLSRGLPADAWLASHPEQIAAVHRAFVERGAHVLRTATLCSRPDGSGVARSLADAVALARAAGPQEVWLSLGPRGAGGSLDGLEQAMDAGADAILLETFVEPTELLHAVSYLAQRGARVIGSLVPGPAGLLCGEPYPTTALRDAGAAGLGLNCGTAPEQALRAWRMAADEGPWFVAPAWGPTLPEVWKQLHGHVRWLGACCGTDPDRWEAAWPS